ncbi:MAG: DUF2961 domain-containing protein, partial [Phycisphaerae bacterium]|nr:DUF2961 domain-containing protein [Phycisphaerae bacterium]
RSQIPGGPDWFANSDGFGREPIPNFEAVLVEPGEDGVGEYLICDVRGPGAIVRTWSAACNGTIRLYLDEDGDDATPVYDGPANAFLFCPYEAMRQAGTAEVDETLLGGVYRQNMAGYCPIPFGKRCRMVWRGDAQRVHFYQVQVRHYERDAAVTTFVPGDLATYRDELARTARILANTAKEYPFAEGGNETKLAATIPPHMQSEFLKLDGPAAIQRLTLVLHASDLERCLRQTVLNIYFDEHTQPQVSAPLGDFFGAAPGINPYDSLPFSVAPCGMMTCRYVMPFAHSARVVIDNCSDESIAVSGRVLPMQYRWDDERSLHFRARWRVDNEVTGDPESVQDMPYLCAAGRGRFVGTAVMLLNPVSIPTPWGGWWGEGDEKIFVDDDVHPSTFGTGSEDYFNYAWSSPDIFAYPYCGQPRNDGPGNRGFVTNQRWQILDDLPFSRRLAFYMELYPHTHVPGMSYARIAYHYASPTTTDDHVDISDADVRLPHLPADWQPVAKYVLDGAAIHQAEALVRRTGELSFDANPLWTGGQTLKWQPAARGEQTAFDVPVPRDGLYTLHLLLALHEGAGRIALELDGQPLQFDGTAELDLHTPYRLLARQYDSEKRELTAGVHTLTIEHVAGSDGCAQATVSVDYIAVKPHEK